MSECNNKFIFFWYNLAEFNYENRKCNLKTRNFLGADGGSDRYCGKKNIQKIRR